MQLFHSFHLLITYHSLLHHTFFIVPAIPFQMLAKLLREICQGAAFAKTGDYGKGKEGHNLYPDDEYMIDLAGARMFDLKSTVAVPTKSGTGGFGVSLFGRHRIMRETAYTYDDETATFSVMIRASKEEAARTNVSRYKLKLHRLVHILARNHDISIFAPGGFVAAGLGDDLTPDQYDAIFNYEPLHRQSGNDARAIRLAQRVHKRCSYECDVDHYDGRTDRRSNGLGRCGPESHRINICLDRVRRVVGDWCYGLLAKAYLGGKITVLSENEFTQEIIEEMIEEAG